MTETNQELTQQFYTRFQAGTSELLGQLDSLRNGSASFQAIDSVAAEVARIRKDLTDAIAFLPGYDQRQCDNKLKDIEAQVEALRSATAPKSKFAFKRKAKPAASPAPVISSPSESIAASTPQSASHQTVNGSSSASHTSGLRLSGHSHSYLTVSSLSTPWSAASDLTISDLDHCVVNLIPSPANPDVPADLTFTALHVRNITNSVLVLPIITGSALLHDMKNCVIALGSRQFRMHTSSGVDVYISIASNPIIEHCSAIRFADYPSSLRPTSLSATQDIKSNYLAVQDFTHIRATPSPNWSALSPEHQIADDAWPLSTGSATDMLHALLPTQGS
ncbi:tubulin binding cofactor C-domain-containing protein [Cubamyces lactineus]|nr:tubulin binding cofactor C-domain-containing protein [Cubamyces lactineus]